MKLLKKTEQMIVVVFALALLAGPAALQAQQGPAAMQAPAKVEKAATSNKVLATGVWVFTAKS